MTPNIALIAVVSLLVGLALGALLRGALYRADEQMSRRIIASQAIALGAAERRVCECRGTVDDSARRIRIPHRRWRRM